MHHVKLRLQEFNWSEITQLVRKKAEILTRFLGAGSTSSHPGRTPKAAHRLSVVQSVGLGLTLANNARGKMTSHKGHLSSPSSSISLSLCFYLHEEVPLQPLPHSTPKGVGKCHWYTASARRNQGHIMRPPQNRGPLLFLPLWSPNLLFQCSNALLSYELLRHSTNHPITVYVTIFLNRRFSSKNSLKENKNFNLLPLSSFHFQPLSSRLSPSY